MNALRLFTVFLFILNVPCAFSNLPNDEQVVKSKIAEWYNQIGLQGKVTPLEFETAIRGHFYYRDKQGLHPNMMGIVDYQKPPQEKRWFIFQFGDNAKMLREEWVAHGCENPKNVPGFFSNLEGSLRSSRGFSVTAGPHVNSKFGKDTLFLKGLEPNINNNMMPRAIVIHRARYVGPTGSGCSWGCLSVASARMKPVSELIRRNILIYGSDGKESTMKNYPFMGGDNLTVSDVNSVNGPDNNPGDEVDPDHMDFESLTSLNEQEETPQGQFDMSGGSTFGGESQALASANSLGEDECEGNTFCDSMTNETAPASNGAKYSGSPSFQDCQNRASAPWSVVVAEAKSSDPNARPEKYFSSTYKVLNEHLKKNVSQATDSVHRTAVLELATQNQQCIAMARSMKNSDFSLGNTPQSFKAKDGSVVCKYEGVSSQDYHACVTLAKTVNDSLDGEVNMVKGQGDSAVANGKSLIDAARNGDTQVDALEAGKKVKTFESQVANERGQFQTAKLEAIDRAQAAMPNRNSILNDCRSYMSGRTSSYDDAKLYMSILDVEDKSVPVHPDPCLSVATTMKTNLVQNIEARKQAIKIIEATGYKIQSLNGKERTLLNQLGQMKKIGLGGNGRGGFNVNNGAIEDFKVKFKKDAKDKVDFSKEGCVGGNCQYSGGSNKELSLSRSRSRGSGSSDFAGDFSRFIGKGGQGSMKGTKNSQVLNFPGSEKGGVYDESFYRNVNLALRGSYPVASLSVAQKKEYYSLLDYHKNKNNKNRNLRHPGRETAGEKAGKNGLGTEIWFDESVDLFKIISNRYRKVFSNF